MSVGDRLKEERLRLGLTQPQLGELVGAAKRTVIDWEKGVSAPNLTQMVPLVAAGMDVQYVVTGVRSNAVPTVSREEASLLDNYRNMPPEERAAWRKMGSALAQPGGAKKSGTGDR